MDLKLHMKSFQYFWLSCSIILAVEIGFVESTKCPKLFNQSNRTDMEISIMESDLQQCDLFNNLIDILEKLNVLIPSNTSCYSLKTVTQNFGKKDVNSQMVQISFKFQENFKNIASDKSSKHSTSHSICTEGPALYNAPYQGQNAKEFAKVTTQNITKNKNESVALATTTNDDDSSGLSHTQVVVIATCSAVIGTFFILAAALRIRNHLKRVREEQQAARRSNNYRLPLSKGPNSFDGHSRKSSSSSRNSQQNSLLDKDGSGYLQGNSKSACQQPLLDAMPRLVVTAPSTAPSTPGDSHGSIQFIDEDTENTKEREKENKDEKRDQEEPTMVITDAGKTNDSKEEIEPFVTQGYANEQSHAQGDNAIAPEVNTRDNVLLLGNSNENPNEQLICESQQENQVNSHESSSSDMHSVNIGLTQSDESLTSHNASYSYGNQAEYASNGYGYGGYCPMMETEDHIENDNHNEENKHNQSQIAYDKNLSNCFCDNGATSFERDELRSAIHEKFDKSDQESRPSFKDTHNVISLDQYEQRRKLQRQDRTMTLTNSFETDPF